MSNFEKEKEMEALVGTKTHATFTSNSDYLKALAEAEMTEICSAPSYVLKTICRNPYTPSETLRELAQYAKDKDFMSLEECLAQNLNTPRDILEEYASHPWGCELYKYAKDTLYDLDKLERKQKKEQGAA